MLIIYLVRQACHTSKISNLEQWTFIITHSFCGSESRSDLVLAHGVSWGHSQDTNQRWASEGCLGLKGHFRVISATRCQVRAGCWQEASVAHMWTSPGSCLSVLAAGGGILPHKWLRREPSGSLRVFSDPPRRPPPPMSETAWWSHRWALSTWARESQEGRATLETSNNTHGTNNETSMPTHNWVPNCEKNPVNLFWRLGLSSLKGLVEWQV